MAEHGQVPRADVVISDLTRFKDGQTFHIHGVEVPYATITAAALAAGADWYAGNATNAKPWNSNPDAIATDTVWTKTIVCGDYVSAVSARARVRTRGVVGANAGGGAVGLNANFTHMAANPASVRSLMAPTDAQRWEPLVRITGFGAEEIVFPADGQLTERFILDQPYSGGDVTITLVEIDGQTGTLNPARVTESSAIAAAEAACIHTVEVEIFTHKIYDMFAAHGAI